MSHCDKNSVGERKLSPAPMPVTDYERWFLLSQRGRLLALAEKNMAAWRVIRDIDARLGNRTAMPRPKEDS